MGCYQDDFRQKQVDSQICGWERRCWEEDALLVKLNPQERKGCTPTWGGALPWPRGRGGSGKSLNFTTGNLRRKRRTTSQMTSRRKGRRTISTSLLERASTGGGKQFATWRKKGARRRDLKRARLLKVAITASGRVNTFSPGKGER